MIGFVIWSLLGVFIIGLGIKDMFSKNPVGFWANTETIKVKDVKDYNRASGLLFIIYGIIFVILGIPLLDGQNTPYVLLSVIGVMVETIVIIKYNLTIFHPLPGPMLPPRGIALPHQPAFAVPDAHGRPAHPCPASNGNCVRVRQLDAHRAPQ